MEAVAAGPNAHIVAVRQRGRLSEIQYPPVYFDAVVYFRLQPRAVLVLPERGAVPLDVGAIDNGSLRVLRLKDLVLVGSENQRFRLRIFQINQILLTLEPGGLLIKDSQQPGPRQTQKRGVPDFYGLTRWRNCSRGRNARRSG